MALSDQQIATVARQAGLTGNAVAIAVAIALAESRGEPTAHNTNRATGDNSYGLWQINMIDSLGPERRAKYGLTSNDQLFDPATNARVMAIMSNKGTTWTPWTTYTRGTYLLYLSRGKAVASGADATVPGNVTTVGVSDTLQGLNGMLEQLRSPQFWKSYLLMAAGALLIVIALFKLTGDNKLSETTKAVGKTALKVAAAA